MYQRILVAVQNPAARSSAALDKAAVLAAACNAELVLYHDLAAPVYIENLPGGSNRALAATRRTGTDTALRDLERLAAPLRRRGTVVSTAAGWDHPAHEAIVRQALRCKADLVVIDPRHRHRFATLLGYTDWELLRECPIPLLLVRSQRRWRRAPLLAAVDPAHAFAKPTGLDALILQHARALGAALHRSVHVLHAYQALPALLQAAAAEDMQQSLLAERAARAASRKLLERLLRGTGISTRRQHLVAGHPIDAIDKTVRQLRTGLLIMGSVSRSGLKRLFIGNTAERVLDTVDCDVLVVRPAQFRTRVPRRSRGLQLLSAQALAPQSVF